MQAPGFEKSVRSWHGSCVQWLMQSAWHRWAAFEAEARAGLPYEMAGKSFRKGGEAERGRKGKS